MGTTNRSTILAAMASMIGISMGQMNKAAAIPLPKPDPDKKDNKVNWGGRRRMKQNARPALGRFMGTQEIARRRERIASGKSCAY